MRRLPRPLRLLWTCAGALWLFTVAGHARAFELTPPPPLSTSGGEVVFLLFTLDNPDGEAQVMLEPRFPGGFRLLSSVQRRLNPGVNLLPLSAEIAANVPAGGYELCLEIEGELAGACARVQVVAREGLTLDVPREVFGDTLELRLVNGGNRTETLDVRGEGEVRFAPVTVTLLPGDAQTLELRLQGVGSLRLFVNERLYLLEVKRLDGAPPAKRLELAAATSFDPRSPVFRPTFTLEGDLSDYAAVQSRLWPQPYLRLDWTPAAVAVGHLPGPYGGLGLWARYGKPWGAEFGIGLAEAQTVFGGGLVYNGAGTGYLRLLYDGALRPQGSVEDLAVWDWRASASFDDSELEAELSQPEGELSFGVRYAYGGSLQLSAGFGEGEARGQLSYRHGDDQQLRLRLDSGPVSWTATGMWAPFRLDWQVGFHDRLGPGRYSLQLGIQDNGPLIGSSYALPVPWLPGLTAGAALQYAGAWRYGGALSYAVDPWSVALEVSDSEAGLQLGYSSSDFGLSVDAVLADELRLSVGGGYRLGLSVPEAVVRTFGGRSWARLSGRVMMADGEGLEGLVVDAGEHRVRSGPDGRYTLWLPAGIHSVGLLPAGIPLETIPPRPALLDLREAERLELDFVLEPAGALHLACSGEGAGPAIGVNLFGPALSSLVYCGSAVGGLPAGSYRLEPFGLGPELIADHPARVEVVPGAMRELKLELKPRPLPEASRPELILNAPSLLTAAPGEELALQVESNAELVYAVLPGGERRPLERLAAERFQLRIQVPWEVTGPLYQVELTAVSGEARLERQTLIRIDPRRALFETRLEPVHAGLGDPVSVTVTTRFTPASVRLTGPGLELVLAADEPYLYRGRFEVPQSWQGLEEVSLTVVVEGEAKLEEAYRFRLSD